MPNVHHQLIIEASPDKIYHCITSTEGLAGWWTPDATAKPEVGTIARFPFGPGYFKEMKILELIPGKLVRWQCIQGAEEWIGTTLSFQLESHNQETLLLSHSEMTGQVQQQTKKEATLLTFHHDNWKEYSPMYAECNYTWGQFLRSLKLLCETGKGRPWPTQHKIETTIPTVETQMLIRKPVSEVFQAFIDPQITTNFWFTKSSGQLETGKTIVWEWEMYGHSETVIVQEIIPNRRILTEWGDPATVVDYEFTALTDETTYVVIKNFGFKETGDELIQAINDNTGGFTTVLDGLKAYLEHGINLNLIADKFPFK